MALNVVENKFVLPIGVESAGTVTKELQTAGTYVDKNIKVEVTTPDGALEAKKNGDNLSFTSKELQIFEDAAYVMARHASPDIEQQTADDWLDSFNMFSIYEVLPHLLELWGLNQKTTSTAKKK